MKIWLVILVLWLAVISVDFTMPGPLGIQEQPSAIVPAATVGGSSTAEQRPYKPETMGPTPSRPTIITPIATVTSTPTATPTPIRGEATWYGGPLFAGKPMRNGDPYNEWDPTTAASNIFPLGTDLEVTYSQTVRVKVKDTGDFAHELDLSRQAFYDLVRSNEPGRIAVDIRVVGP